MSPALARAGGVARAAWRHRTGRRDRPRMLTYTVTFACNARCVMCDSWKLRVRDELSTDEVAAIFAQLPRMDYVRLTGGEPFLRRDLPELARLVRERLDPLALHVTTNGFLTDRVVALAEGRDRSLPLFVLVSIDGLGAKHDEVRGRSYAWKRSLATLEALAPRRRELNLELAVNQTVIDAEAAGQYRALRERLAPLGVVNHVVVAYDESATYSTERGRDLAPSEEGGYRTFGALRRDQVALLLDQAQEDLAGLPFVERAAKRYYLRGLRTRLLGTAGRGHPAPRPPCVALSSHLRLLPDGDVPTCQFNGRVVGNLREQAFAELWEGERAREQREWVRRCPGCWAECEVLPSAVYTGDLLRAAW